MATPSDPRQARILAMFAGELADRTRILEDGLLALPDAAPDERRALLDELARAAHTLKGSAGMMGFPEVATICHELEETLGDLRRREHVDPALVDRLLADVDRIRATARETTGSVDLPPARSGPVSAPKVDQQPGVLAPEAPSTSTPARAPAADAGGSVRLPARKLDRLVSSVAELRAATTALSVLPDLDREMRPLLRGVDRAVAAIDHAVRDTVTVPVRDACDGLARIVHDVAGTQDKDVRLRLSVGDAEIDRRAVGVVRDALVHLVRNAVDHGLEPPADRATAGKPTQGTVEVIATVQGDRVAVTVRDDGRGVDRAAVQAAAADAGLATDRDAHELIFTSGLSTARVTTDISGRGIGLDAVRARVEALGGGVTLRSEPGQGTEVTLTVPASLATASVLLVEVGGEQLALLTTTVRRLLRVGHDDIVISDGRSWVPHEDGLVSLTSLGDLAGLPVGTAATERRTSPAVVVASATGGLTALVVDRVIGEQELLIQPLGAGLDHLPGLVGAGVLASGKVVLLFHPAALVRTAREQPSPLPIVQASARGNGRGRVLLVEDSPTTRALEQGLVEAAGYDVVPASDGHEAWERLRAERVDVVVSDIEMPRLDGIALCQRIRSSPILRELPIVLVTSRGTDEDRRRGAEAGADAYLVKSSFAQGELIATIARLLA